MAVSLKENLMELLYIYLYLLSNKHFNLDTFTHTLVCFKNSFNDIYVLFDL